MIKQLNNKQQQNKNKNKQQKIIFLQGCPSQKTPFTSKHAAKIHSIWPNTVTYKMVIGHSGQYSDSSHFSRHY